MSKTAKRAIGDAGESQACDWLRSRGFLILDRNVSNHFGEIDIIAKRGRVIHFVEVKTRRGHRVGSAVEAGMGRKLEKSMRTAQALAEKHYQHAPLSMDILSIDGDQIRLFENVTL